MKKLAFSIFFCALISFANKGSSLDTTHFSSINETQFYLVYYNIFAGGIYDIYHAQLQAFLQKEIQDNKTLVQILRSPPKQASIFVKDGIDFFNAIFNPLPEEHFAKALYHENMINRLRYLINQKNKLRIEQYPLSQLIIDLIDKLTIWMFTQPDLSEPSKKFMYEQSGLDKRAIAELYNNDPVNFINNVHDLFAKNPRFTGNEKLEGILNDPVLYGDMPMKIFHLNNVKQTNVIRTPNVAHDLIVNGTITSFVNDEFRNYLVASQGKMHFYVNLLARDKEEDLRKTTVIENLEKDPVAGRSLLVITLEKQKSSDFYFQKGEYKDLSDAHQFKQIFFAKLFANEGFYWCSKIEIAPWREKVAEILEEVHRWFFKNQEELTNAERQDFIEISYVKFIEALADEFDVDVLNISCKQSVDRGPSLYMLLYLHDRLKLGASMKNEYQKLYWLYFSPPIAFHNRAGHDYRVARFQSAANRMIEAYQH